MNALSGIIIGLLSFLIIGLFHQIVIKAEYYWGVKTWPLFVVGGTICLVTSLFAENIILSGGLGVAGFSFFYPILQLSIAENCANKKRMQGWPLTLGKYVS